MCLQDQDLGLLFWCGRETTIRRARGGSSNDVRPSNGLQSTRMNAEENTMHTQRLGNEGGSGSGLVLEGRRDGTLGLVVTGQTVDTRLDENEAELGVHVLAVRSRCLRTETAFLMRW